MEQSSCRYDEPEFSLREWGIKARISRENTASRRYSASYIRSFREDSRSFRSNITICSTASSPGYSLKDEIDPSTYSFTTALKALQARTVYNTWECLSPEGFALNSKWNEAEKYICNPLSGEVPMECLSAKTLSGRTVQQDILQFPGTQSTPPDLSSDSLSPASTPSILDRALKHCGTETGDSTDSNTKSKADEKVEEGKTRENKEKKKKKKKN
ncbi:Detected protein of unknown function [Hibiscus syriacus]|uniref:Uncharacterized protein n=1 Tax=Hibiscus syriacus TaxID=106335 RepID=A0A6A3BCK4_HIBSY|nr:Detected protein of unknown function [Hibiscus syriacus]